MPPTPTHTYLIVPMGFNQLNLCQRQRFVLALQSAKPLVLTRREEDAALMARAMVARVKRVGVCKMHWNGQLKVYTVGFERGGQKDAGAMVVMQNCSSQYCEVGQSE